MNTARKPQSKAAPKRKTRCVPAPTSFTSRPRPVVSKKLIAQRLRWLDEDVPIKPKRPIEGEELEEAIRTGGL